MSTSMAQSMTQSISAIWLVNLGAQKNLKCFNLIGWRINNLLKCTTDTSHVSQPLNILITKVMSVHVQVRLYFLKHGQERFAACFIWDYIRRAANLTSLMKDFKSISVIIKWLEMASPCPTKIWTKFWKIAAQTYIR